MDKNLEKDYQEALLFMKYANNDIQKCHYLQDEYWKQQNILLDKHCNNYALKQTLLRASVIVHVILCGVAGQMGANIFIVLLLALLGCSLGLYSIINFKYKSFERQPVNLWLAEYADLN